jgi:hypothetical protein
MRLSYHAGAIQALLESGLTFSHIDSTSGGSINLAMLLSGLTPTEMCDRWRTLNLLESVSLMPLDSYIKTRDMVALGSADGLRNKSLPHLGIDIEKIRAARGVEATFNVCNYTTKTNEVIPHTEIDVDMLIAGMSLPMVMPPVPKGDELFIDSAFIRDANLMEAIKRGADELWVVWGLGNTNQYRGGILNLYIQMLEMSAHGALHEDFERLEEINERIRGGETVYGRTSPIVLHFIKPEYPLPLDPELYLGRTDAATLIDTGYSDAKKYLDDMRETGVAATPQTTRMFDPAPGITFRESMSGGFSLGATDVRTGEAEGDAAGTPLSLHLTVTIRDLATFIDGAEHHGQLTGRMSFSSLGTDISAKHGTFKISSSGSDQDLKLIEYELGFERDGHDYFLTCRKEIHDDPGIDLLKDLTTLFVSLHDGPDVDSPVIGRGILHVSPTDLLKLSTVVSATSVDSIGERAILIARFGRFFMGELWETRSISSRGGRFEHWISRFRALWPRCLKRV